MNHNHIIREQISAEAVDWFLRFEGGKAQPDLQAFSEWLTRSPLHIEEFLEVSCAWGALNVHDSGSMSTDALIAAARTEPAPANVVEWPHNGPESSAPKVAMHTPVGRTRTWAGLAAAVLIVLVGGLRIFLHHPIATADYATAIGEQRSVVLADGSVVYLNANSEVHLAWSASERHIDLMRGEARFRVAKNAARPFIVATSEATVRAVGTVFDVRIDPMRTQVAVIEGRVEVNSQLDGKPAKAAVRQNPERGENASAPAIRLPSNVQLGAGERAAITTSGIEANIDPAVQPVIAWSGRLVFRDEPLAEVIGEFNRYGERSLVIDDPQLATLSINGVFEPNDQESLLAYLEGFETVQVTRLRNGTVHLSRGASAKSSAQ